MNCKDRSSFVKTVILFIIFGTILFIAHFPSEKMWQDSVTALKNIGLQIHIKEEMSLTPCDVNFRSPVTETDDEYTKNIKTRILNAEARCPANRPTSYLQGKVYMEISKYVAVDRLHKLLLLPLPKTASTSLQEVFAHIAVPQLQNKSISDIHKMHYWYVINKIPRLNKVLHSNGEAEAKSMLEDYFKFTFVREPFHRILSAFRNKFLQHPRDYYRKNYGKIATQYEETFLTEVNPNTTKEIDGRLYTFRSFFRYLARTGCVYYDIHWGCYLSRSLPCEMKYDFIGKLETIEEDFNFLSRCKLQVGNYKAIFPNSKPTANDAYNEFYATVEDEDILKVYEIFQHEYEYFGYPMPDIVSNAKERFLKST